MVPTEVTGSIRNAIARLVTNRVLLSLVIWSTSIFLSYGQLVNSPFEGGLGIWYLTGIYEPFDLGWEYFNVTMYWPLDQITMSILIGVPLFSLFSALVLELLVVGYGRVKIAGVIVSVNLILQLVDSLVIASVEPSTRLIPYPFVGLFQLFVFIIAQRNFDSFASRRPLAYRVAMSPTILESNVKILRGGEFIGNRLRYKVKIQNDSRYNITDVMVSLVSYPKDSLKLEGEHTKRIEKIDPSGFRSPTFDFLPTADCVKGEVIAAVSYVDPEGKAHSVTTEPYTIRAVCDLLQTEVINAKEFEVKLSNLEHGETTLQVADWTPELMHTKALQVLENSNFFEVGSESSIIGEQVESRITGWARGKYTGKNVGLEIVVTGRPKTLGAKCRIRISGEDQAMIMPAIDEISQKLSAWFCPMCGGNLPKSMVDELKAGKSVACPFCGVTIDR